MKALPRELLPKQLCQVWVYDAERDHNALLFETETILLEAPNWSGNNLILNGAGTLWRMPINAPALEPINIGGIPPLNNDHVLDPNGTDIIMSAYDDWQLYRAPIRGGTAEKITDKENPEGLMHFLHGVSPDGKELSFVGLKIDHAAETFNILYSEIFTVGADGRNYRQVTNDATPVDGPEYSPDGQWLYFNTELYTGHAQIARMRRDGTDMERLSFAETVDWFPHWSPDGSKAVYLAYPAGTRGHPANLDVGLMLVRDGKWNRATQAAKLLGGQGTINVNSWSPDSMRFAYVAYPFKR